MIAILLVLALGAATFIAPRFALRDLGRDGERFAQLMLLGFVTRMIAHFALRNMTFFSGGGSIGDAGVYQMAAWTVARLWEYQGVQWFSPEDLEIEGARQALLAVHVFGTITWLNGGGEVPTLACTSLNAFLAALTCLHLVRLGTMIGGTPRDSQFVALAMYFSPAFVFHTSDMFKDGLSAFLVVSAVLVSFRLSERFSVLDVVLGLLCLLLLWFVRFYLVFLVTAPLVLSLTGIRAGGTARMVLASAAIFAIGLVLIATQVADTAVDVGMRTYEHATSENALAWNAQGGSGVEFDNSNPWISFPQKLAYTLLSPFPWDFRSSSIGFQIGRVDAIVWAFFMYRGVRGARRMWHDDRGTLLMFLIVLVPLTVAYAATMANIGLIVRQRIPIVMLGSILAVRGLPLPRLAPAAAAEPSAEPS